MPEMDGVEATEQIHQEWPPEQRPRIIAMTADALIGDRERYLSAGMDDYISKPVSVDELVRALTDTQTRLEQIDQHPEGSGLLTDPSHPIDLTYLYEIVGDDSELMGQFIENLLVDLDHRLSDVRQAINQQDSSKLERFAHLLRTSSANMGAMHLSDLFRKLEYQGRMNQLQGTKELLVEVEELCKQVILALSAERDLLSQETK
jgi:DNA-binding response OmpR family regulator